MQWLVALETESDLITTCRLVNLFRRKGLKIVTLAMASRPAGFAVMSVVETPEAEVEHIFNLLRRTEGVLHVTYYRHEPLADASFVFVDSDASSSRVARFLQEFPGCKLAFASHGKYLLEIPAESRSGAVASGLGEPGFLPFTCVKSARNAPHPEPAGVQVP